MARLITLANRYKQPLGLVEGLAALFAPRASDEDELVRLVDKALALVWEYKG